MLPARLRPARLCLEILDPQSLPLLPAMVWGRRETKLHAYKSKTLYWRHFSHAILEQLDGMGWLYLTAPDSMTIDRDCPVFTTMPPPEKVDWKLIGRTGQPPPITKDVATTSAVIEHPIASEFGSFWSADGQSVALVQGGQIIGMIVAGAERGHSRALSKESPLGLPFDDALASRTFPEFQE